MLIPIILIIIIAIFGDKVLVFYKESQLSNNEKYIEYQRLLKSTENLMRMKASMGSYQESSKSFFDKSGVEDIDD